MQLNKLGRKEILMIPFLLFAFFVIFCIHIFKEGPKETFKILKGD